MNPFLLEAPAQISFSGGRTSAYMLRQILDAHGGGLPAGVHVVFANTGKERPETLDFVQRCAAEWRVPVRWVEWRASDDPQARFAEVDYSTAARNGEPFSALVRWKKMLPNPVMRLCTMHLKIETMKLFALHVLNMEEWTTAVGIRYDEPHRWRIRGQDSRNRREFKIAPLVDAKITEPEILAWWEAQPFDLGLERWEGNCDLCFLKGRKKRERIMRDRPDLAPWWVAEEAAPIGATGRGALFRSDTPSYAALLAKVQGQPSLFPVLPSGDLDDLGDCTCTD